MKEAAALGIPCYGLRFFMSRFNLFISSQLRKIFSSIQADLIHVHGGRAGFFFVASLFKIPMVYTIHGFHFLEKPLILRWMALVAERLIFRCAGYAIFVSRHDLELAEKYQLCFPHAKGAVINPGLSLNDLPQPLPHSVRHIGFIGRLEYQKDPLLFLKMMGLLPEYSATMVGGGALDPIVKQEIQNRGLGGRIHMVGQLSHKEALKILATLSAVILTSRWEGLPILILEAMGIGVPVISMNVSGIGEIIQNGSNGLLVERRSGKDLAEKVEMVTKDVALRASIIRNAKATIQGQFALEKMLTSILRIYKDLSNSDSVPLGGK
jgi:glycosyltransferase involved in cell wall biosynthesis